MRHGRPTWTRRDDGAVAVIVAILLVVFIGFTALVVDVGYWYNVRRQLQAAADSAALAGCEQLKAKGTATDAFAEATAYALKNAVPPADGLEVMPLGTGATSSEVGADFVKITVRKAAPEFFSGIFGGSGGFIMAQSKAQLQWVYGMRGLVPLAMPVLAAPKRVTVSIGGTEYSLAKGADDVWRGSGIPGGTTAGTTGRKVTLTVYNSRNVPTTIDDAGRVVVRPADCPITQLSFSTLYPVSGDAAGIDVWFVSTTQPVEAMVGHTKYPAAKFVWDSVTKAGHLHIDAPVTDQLEEPFAFSISVKNPAGGNQDYMLSNAATIVARRSTYPIGIVGLDPGIMVPGGTFSVAVALHSYEYGKLYEMKVTDGMGDTGDYMKLDFGTIYNADGSIEYSVGNGGSQTYYTYLGSQFPYILHIGDIIDTLPGNTPVKTYQGLDNRIASDSRTFADWVAAGKPRGWPRLVYVPVMEFANADKTSGKRPLVIVNFASFYIENYDQKEGVAGRFVEYVSNGDVLGTDQPPEFGVQAPRLVPNGVSF